MVDKQIEKMVDAVADGDLSAAGEAFDTAVAAKREAALQNAATEFADKVFDEPADEEESEEEVSDGGSEEAEGDETPAPVNPHLGR